MINAKNNTLVPTVAILSNGVWFQTSMSVFPHKADDNVYKRI